MFTQLLSIHTMEVDGDWSCQGPKWTNNTKLVHMNLLKALLFTIGQ